MAKPKASPAEILRMVRLFYGEEWTKAAIAAKLHIDPRTVKATLKRARESGIVSITINEIDTTDRSLEEKFKAHFPHMQTVLTLPTLKPIVTADDYAALLKRFAALAAKYLDTLIDQHGDRRLTISVGGGRSIMEVIDAMKRKPRPHLRILQIALVGHGILPKIHVNPIGNALSLWDKSGQHPLAVEVATASPLPRELKELEPSLDQLAKNPDAAEALQRMTKDVDVVLASINALNPPTKPDLSELLCMTSLLQRKIMTPAELEGMGAVADFCYQMIDRNGESVINPATKKPLRYFLTAGDGTAYGNAPTFLRHLVAKKKHVIAIAGSAHKVPAIMAALKGKLFNVLVTDEDTCREIVNLAEAATPTPPSIKKARPARP